MCHVTVECEIYIVQKWVMCITQYGTRQTVLTLTHMLHIYTHYMLVVSKHTAVYKCYKNYRSQAHSGSTAIYMQN